MRLGEADGTLGLLGESLIERHNEVTYSIRRIILTDPSPRLSAADRDNNSPGCKRAGGEMTYPRLPRRTRKRGAHRLTEDFAVVRSLGRASLSINFLDDACVSFTRQKVSSLALILLRPFKS